MYKRLSIRLVPELAERVTALAKKRGLSVNALVTQAAWEFIEDWNRAHSADEHTTTEKEANP